ncbi:TPA: DUF1073 domain-containing protein [Mannheimia haemolytica]|nr:DUF1073 domain-containing protein [Mannheimia haemolytica]HDL1237559.1 DUF1073 domain-containing protein [Mannheimia haemolytica]
MFGWFKKEEPKQEIEEPKSYWANGKFYRGQPSKLFLDVLANIVQRNNEINTALSAGQDGDSESRLKMLVRNPEAISVALADWYASKAFIGYQMCAVLSQNWLVGKACSVPARDATRNGFDVVSINGDEISDETIKLLQRFDKKYRIRWHCEEFVRLGRVFGMRIALFDIESSDPEFYEKPFNLDGVEPNSYKGIIQIDPYWCVPILVGGELNNPASQHFYEPTYWQINGKKYHRSHLMIFRNDEVPDILKPVYMYGGISTPQKIMERVYSAERTTDESLGLVTSKRTTVWQTNMDAFMADFDGNRKKIQAWIATRDNYGIKVGDKDDDQFSQYDTTLSDLDEVIMTNYQIVAAAANVPVTKLLGTSPKGFSTGAEEAKNYHQELESIQEHDLTEFVERHHQLVMKSFGNEVEDTTINWRPVDSPTAKELAELNKLKADTYSTLIMAGVIDGADARTVLVKDREAGFNDLGNVSEDLDLTEEEIALLNSVNVEQLQNAPEQQAD